MNKKGFSMQWILTFYLIIIVFVFAMLYGKIAGNKDDTAYHLDFYARDVAYGIEAMLWAEGNVSYVYPLKKYYALEVNYDGGKVTAKKERSWSSYTFRTREEYLVEVAPYLEYQGGNFENPYLITKKEKLP